MRRTSWLKNVICALAAAFTITAPPAHSQDQTPRRNPIRPMIVGGFNATSLHQFPWQVSIGYIDNTGYHSTCGGSIIAPDVVLTAAHCAFDMWGRELESPSRVIYSGSSLLPQANGAMPEGGHYTSLYGIFVHPFYSQGTGPGGANVNDVALFFTRPNSQGTNFADLLTGGSAVIPLNATSPALSTLSLISGWGTYFVSQSSGGTYLSGGSPILKYANLTVVPCAPGHTDQGQFCTRPLGQVNDGLNPTQGNSCTGDSGGPLVMYDATGRNPRQIGVVSSGNATCSGVSLYTSVAYYSGFITAGLNAAALNRGRSLWDWDVDGASTTRWTLGDTIYRLNGTSRSVATEDLYTKPDFDPGKPFDGCFYRRVPSGLYGPVFCFFQRYRYLAGPPKVNAVVSFFSSFIDGNMMRKYVSCGAIMGIPQNLICKVIPKSSYVNDQSVVFNGADYYMVYNFDGKNPEFRPVTRITR
jgi:secreted trypsin-like serine protease